VAIHTRRSGRYTRDFGLLCPRVTVQALNLVITRVNLVRKSNRLSGLVALLIAQP
jgi:hypothetical protein